MPSYTAPVLLDVALPSYPFSMDLPDFCLHPAENSAVLSEWRAPLYTVHTWVHTDLAYSFYLLQNVMF